jgi:hypothetical protein
MKIITHEKNIRRNAKIGQFTSIGALLILAGGMYISFVYPTQFYLSFICLVVGFILSQVGIFYGNRWGRHPRIDEQLMAALKGLTKDYTLFNFITPVSHLLVGPAGVWIIEPYYQRGTIAYQGGKWKQKGGGITLAYLKIFAQEGLGRPDLEAKTDLDGLTDYIKKAQTDDQLIPPINVAMVFTDPRVILEPEGSPIPAMKIEQLKEFFRNSAKQNPLPAPEIKRILEILPEESIE